MKDQCAGGADVNSESNAPGNASKEALRVQTAAYIEDLVRELEDMAAQHRMEPLRDLLRLAKEEARKTAFGM